MEDSDDGNGSHAAPSTAAAGAAAFTITTELALSSDISIACWCPTMDLCAVVSADGQLHLHRMDWQLLWAVSPEALITAVTWRPDGKEIAAGHANGAISILDVETGDKGRFATCRNAKVALMQRMQLRASRTALHWTALYCCVELLLDTLY
jgi:WD40 repeat protein